jgi:hypothetical protein
MEYTINIPPPTGLSQAEFAIPGSQATECEIKVRIIKLQYQQVNAIA